MPNAVDALYISSDNLVMVVAKSKATGLDLTGATVTLLRLVEDLGVDADGVEVDGDTVAGSENIDCPEVEGTPGTYYGTLPMAVAALVTSGADYAGYVYIDGGAGRRKTFRRKARAVWANA